MTVTTLDPTDLDGATRVVEIQQAAYAVEAKLIDFDRIPQLSETAQDVMGRTDLDWRGVFDQGQLAGIIAWSIEKAVVDIDRLAIDPAFARRGYGRALVRAIPSLDALVMTGAKNYPAQRLYRTEGFIETGEVEISSGVFLTQFSRPVEAKPPASDAPAT